MMLKFYLLITWVTNYSLIFVRNFSINLQVQCCHGNFTCNAKMASRFENDTDNEHNLSPMTLIANQVVDSSEGSGNYLILGKTQVKSFFNFASISFD